MNPALERINQLIQEIRKIDGDLLEAELGLATHKVYSQAVMDIFFQASVDLMEASNFLEKILCLCQGQHYGFAMEAA